MNAMEKEQIMKILREKVAVKAMDELKEKYATRAVVYEKKSLMNFISNHPRLFMMSLAPMSIVLVGILDSVLS